MSFLFAGRLPGNTQSHSRGQSLPAESNWELNCEELHAAGQGESTLYSPTGIKNKNSLLLPKVTWANRWHLIRSGKSEYGVGWAWISSLIEEINPDCDSNVTWREISLLIRFPQLVILIHSFEQPSLLTALFMQVTATDHLSPHQKVNSTINIVLLDENDNSPTFRDTPYRREIFHNMTAGMAILQVLEILSTNDIFSWMHAWVLA